MSEKLSRISFLDKAISTVLGLFTSEMSRVNKAKKKNGYDDKRPTIKKI